MPALENVKHEAFSNEYIRDLHQTKAYQRVYQNASYDTARNNSARLLANASISARIDELKAERAKSLKIDQEAVLHDLKTYLSADITDFIELTPKQVKALPLEVRRMVTGFKSQEKTTYTAEGSPIIEKRFELQFFDKKAAYEMVNKHIGFYEKDNSQQRPFNVVVSNPDEAEKLKKI